MVSQPRTANQARTVCSMWASVRVVIVEVGITLQESVLVVHQCTTNGVVVNRFTSGDTLRNSGQLLSEL